MHGVTSHAAACGEGYDRDYRWATYAITYHHSMYRIKTNLKLSFPVTMTTALAAKHPDHVVD